jgi:hypothetical protein
MESIVERLGQAFKPADLGLNDAPGNGEIGVAARPPGSTREIGRRSTRPRGN